jgi:hypothetical protein
MGMGAAKLAEPDGSYAISCNAVTSESMREPLRLNLEPEAALEAGICDFH